MGDVVGEGLLGRHFHTLAVGGRDIVASSPGVDLLLASLFASIILGQATQIAVVPFVEGLILLAIGMFFWPSASRTMSRVTCARRNAEV